MIDNNPTIITCITEAFPFIARWLCV